MARSSGPRWRPGARRRVAWVGALLAALLLVGLPTLSGGAPSVPARPGPTFLAPPANRPRAVPSGLPVPSAEVARASVAPALYNLSRGWAWSPLDPTTPGASAGAGFAPMSPAGTGLLFGGEAVSGLSNATALYNETENSWTPVATSVAPSPRSDFAFGSDPGGTLAVLFGGITDAATGAVTNDTWVFSIATDSWTNLTSAVAPAARADAALAVDDGVAVLYGGWAPNASGIGEITYSDTWTLNLSTDLWSRDAHASGSGPGAVHGASMTYAPDLGEFLLFGGCYPCSSSVYYFDASTGSWSLEPSAGAIPTGRMDAVWQFDPASGLVVLFGGSDGTASFNDTFLFNTALFDWTELASAGAPSPRSRAAAACLDAPGNETVLLTGGSNGTAPIAGSWRLSPVANLTVQVANATSLLPIAKADVVVNGAAPVLTNATGIVSEAVAATATNVTASALGYANASEERWLAPGADVTVVLNLPPVPASRVVVHTAAVNGSALPGTFVNLSVEGKLFQGSPGVTNASGNTTFVGVPSTRVEIAATHLGFHPMTVNVSVPSGVTFDFGLVLTPLLELSVRALGDLPNGTTVPLEFVSLSLNEGPANLTGLGGWRNFTTALLGLTTLHARLYGFQPIAEGLFLNFTGVVPIRLTLHAGPFPAVTVQAFLAGGTARGGFVEDAKVSVFAVTPLPIGPFHATYRAGPLGSVDFSPVPGNYSLSVSAPGCETNDSIPILDAQPGTPVYVPVGLTPLPLVDLHTRAVSADGGHAPIAGALVHLAFSALDVATGNVSPVNVSLTTPASGWANASDVPQSIVFVNVSAPGYITNLTSIYLAYGEAPVTLVVWLTPVPTGASTPVGLRIVPAGAGNVWALFLLPSLGILGAIVFLTVLRTPTRPGRDDRATARPPSGESTGNPPPR